MNLDPDLILFQTCVHPPMWAQHRTPLPSLTGQGLWPGVHFFGTGPFPDTVHLRPGDGQAEGRVWLSFPGALASGEVRELSLSLELQHLRLELPGNPVALTSSLLLRNNDPHLIVSFKKSQIL